MTLQALAEPTSYATGNLAWHMPKDVDLVRFIASLGTVSGFVESREKDGDPVDVNAILSDKWQVRQDLRDGRRSGTAVSVRVGRKVRLRRVVTWMSNRAGRWRDPVQDRWLKIAHVVDNGIYTRVIVIHFATENSGQQKQSRRALRKAINRANRAGVRWVAMGDFNTDVPALARSMGAEWCHSVDVMGIFGGAGRTVERDGRGWGHMTKAVYHHRSTDHGIPVVTEALRRVGAKGIGEGVNV